MRNMKANEHTGKSGKGRTAELVAVLSMRELLPLDVQPSGRFFPSFLVEMHGKGGNFCNFLLKIAEKEGKTDLASIVYRLPPPAFAAVEPDSSSESSSESSLELSSLTLVISWIYWKRVL